MPRVLQGLANSAALCVVSSVRRSARRANLEPGATPRRGDTGLSRNFLVDLQIVQKGNRDLG